MQMFSKFIRFILLLMIFVFHPFLDAKEMKMPKKRLQIPNLAQDRILAYKAGVRPYRTKGIRLEPEYWQDKLIIHDYGHGGSGISLSRGSAHLSFEILLEELSAGFQPANKEVAILGAGIIGLTTAHLLVDQGWQVHVYASQFPPNTTSDIAPGLWNKVVVGGDQSESQKQLLERILRLSFQEFKALSENKSPEFEGVSPLKIYTFKPHPPMQNLPKGLIPEGIPIQAHFGKRIRKKGMFYQSLLVDTSIYIPQLYEKAKTKGVQFTEKTFYTQSDLAHLSQSIIFNCTGFGSKILFNDLDLIPVTGQLIELKPQEGVKDMLSGPLKDDLDLYMIPIHNKIILGGSYEFNHEENQANVQICEKILSNARQFFSK